MTASSDTYYLQDARGYVGNAVSWHRQGNHGYTCDPREAHVFTWEQAIRAHRNRATDVPWPKEYIDERTSMVVDMQHLDFTVTVLVEDGP